MDSKQNWSNLCRICLQVDAVIPLFENGNDQKTVCSKLITCMHETVILI